MIVIRLKNITKYADRFNINHSFYILFVTFYNMHQEMTKENLPQTKLHDMHFEYRLPFSSVRELPYQLCGF